MLNYISIYASLIAINWNSILMATIVVGATGLIIGVLLGIAAIKLEVPVNEKELEIRELLPGVNCGACGYPGCDGLAQAIANGEAPADGCPVANSEAHKKIADLMGQEIEEKEKQVAFVNCLGNCEKSVSNTEYQGEKTCKAADESENGPKACKYGCLGFGECVDACSFDAIHIVDGIAVVDKEKCTACGLCVKECPRELIELVPVKARHLVACTSEEKGKDVKVVCSIGCIGCRLCVKACEYDAIAVNNNLAKIDYEKCTNCGKCAEVCPVKVIHVQSA